MSLPVAAVGALVAALLETSVLTELTVFGLKPDLVFVVTIVVAMAVGFEDALVWAVVGGILIDALSGRPIGATSLALLVVTGIATLAARFSGAPRVLSIATVVFVLAWVFQIVLLAILAVTAGVGIGDVPVQRLLAIAFLDLTVAVIVVSLYGALYRRFASAERMEW